MYTQSKTYSFPTESSVHRKELIKRMGGWLSSNSNLTQDYRPNPGLYALDPEGWKYVRPRINSYTTSLENLDKDINRLNLVSHFFRHPVFDAIFDFELVAPQTKVGLAFWNWGNMTQILTRPRESDCPEVQSIGTKVMNPQQFYYLFLFIDDNMHAIVAESQKQKKAESDLLADDDDKIIDDECCICMEQNHDVVLACSHAFCRRCIESWTARDDSCPMCRTQVDQKEEFIVTEFSEVYDELRSWVFQYISLLPDYI